MFITLTPGLAPVDAPGLAEEAGGAGADQGQGAQRS